MNNFTKIGMPILVVLFLLIAAVSITMSVTKENTLKQVAAASNTPVSTVETQLARTASTPTYALNAQPDVSIPNQSTVSSPVNDYSTANNSSLPSCHGSGTQINGTTTGYNGGGCGGGRCRGNAGPVSSASPGSASGASCH